MNVLNSRAAMVVGGIAAVGLVVYFFGRKIGAVGKQAVEAVSNINQGTPYEGAGVVGTLGNAANRLSGGFFQSAGEWIGGKVFDVFNKPYDPNNPNTPRLRQAAQKASPVRPEDVPTVFIR